MVQVAENSSGGSDLVGEGRQVPQRPLAVIVFDLQVEQLMLLVRLEQRHRLPSRARSSRGPIHGTAPGLADLVAVPAGDIVTHRGDDVPPARIISSAS